MFSKCNSISNGWGQICKKKNSFMFATAADERGYEKKKKKKMGQREQEGAIKWDCVYFAKTQILLYTFYHCFYVLNLIPIGANITKK